VTGHRAVADVKRVLAGIDEALDRIEHASARRLPLVISPLAEGADCLVAERVLARPGGRLVVPLPLPQEDYLTDFTADASRRKFLGLLARADRIIQLPPAATREAAYEAAGQYVLEHCDVLLAVWDGREVQGEGGTGQIVARGRAMGKPIVIVRAGNRIPGTRVATSLGEEQGRVLVERLPEERRGDG
jgi:hypothetical protein